MSKIACDCGHVIRDQTDSLPHKGEILRVQDSTELYESVSDEAQRLVDAMLAGDREGWMRRHFLDGYPRDLSEGSMFHDYFLVLLLKKTLLIYECDQCGRLLVQRKTGSDEFVSFAPETGRYEALLKSESPKSDTAE